MPNPKKKNRKRKNKRTASGTIASTVPKESDNNNAFQYGDLLLELILDAVPASDLIPLRCLNRRARDFIDCRIFDRITFKTDEEAGSSRVILVMTETGQRLPLPALTPMSPKKSIGHVFGALEYTSVLDLENVDVKILDLLGSGTVDLTHLKVLRLKSDVSGYHTYDLFECFGASTIVVFPSFYPFLGWRPREDPVFIPDGATKVVQHIAYAVDWRGPVLFDTMPSKPLNVKEEVWVMKHADIDVDYGHFHLWDDRVYDAIDALHETILEQIAARLDAGVNLTVVGWESVRSWGHTLFGIFPDDLDAHADDENIKKAVRNNIPVKKSALSNLHFKTWKEYAATLSPEQLKNENLPRSYLKRWRALKAEKYKGAPDPDTAYDSESELGLDFNASEFPQFLQQLFQHMDGMP